MRLFLLLFGVLIAASSWCQNTNNSAITETENGYVGIGTTTPDALLTVNGTIHTREVVIDLKGAVAPDYVFEYYYTGVSTNTDYRFLSLAELEDFLQQNHHLPKIPPAKELEEDGMSLKEMNLLLLEKVEELTLHTIAQQKEIDALKEQLEALENE